MALIALIFITYFIGATPFAYIIAKMHGINLSKVGSGNIGATNLSRACGKKWSYPCFLLDVCKGLIPMLIASTLVSDNPSVKEYWLWLAVGCMAIIGHVFPIYLKFKGGKGVATSLGVVLGLWPFYTIPGLICFAIWCILVLTFKYVSLASCVVAGLFPIILATGIAISPKLHFSNLYPLVIFAAIMGSLVIFLHRTNLNRLTKGNENKVFQNKK